MKTINGISVLLAMSGCLLFSALNAQTASFVSVKISQPAIPDPMSSILPAQPAAIEKTNFVFRDIFNLVFGHYRDAIALVDEAMKSNLFPPNSRILTDFTGDSYRMIFEAGFNSLADYEKAITTELNQAGWRDWYEKFKPHVESSSREILRWVR